MEDGDLENNHNKSHAGSGNRLSAEYLPLIDMRLSSQSEPRALSHCASLSPSYSSSLAASAGVVDDLTLKIDRSVFNVYQRPNLNSVQNVLMEDISIKRKRGMPRKVRNHDEETEVLDLTGEALAYASVDSNLGMESRYGGLGISMDLNSVKRKRGRPPKNRDGFSQPAVNWRSKDKEEIVNLGNREGSMVDVSALDKEELVKLENREGTMVDLSALANGSEDPYGEELRRVTVGLKTKEEFLGVLEQLNGEWVNIGKKKKVVKACDFGGYLPKGWKLMLYIKKRGSNVLLACRRYVSPDGQQFETCKEVSTFLQSLLESRNKHRLNSLQSDNKTPGQPVMANKSLLGKSDSIHLPVLGPETKQNLEGGRTGSEVLEEVKGTENGDVADPTSLEAKDDIADFLNGDYENDMKKRDGDMENLAALSNSEAQSREKNEERPVNDN